MSIPSTCFNHRVASVGICRVVVNQMIEQARREHPMECCGLLYGKGEVIDGIRPTRNQKHSNCEFSVSPKDMLKFFKELRAAGKKHLGIYHSHPLTEPRPSERDVAEFHYPEASYWIVSLKNQKPQVRCFRWIGNGFQGVPFNLTEV